MGSPLRLRRVSPVLWGILGAILRIVPYVGTIISPTAVLFLVAEPTIGQVKEPLVYGAQRRPFTRCRRGIRNFLDLIVGASWTNLMIIAALLIRPPRADVCAVRGLYQSF
jgi:hypothetical protein